MIIVFAKLLQRSKEQDLYSFCHSDTGTSKTNYRHVLLVNSSSENFEKCCDSCSYRLIGKKFNYQCYAGGGGGGGGRDRAWGGDLIFFVGPGV